MLRVYFEVALQHVAVDCVGRAGQEYRLVALAALAAPAEPVAAHAGGLGIVVVAGA